MRGKRTPNGYCIVCPVEVRENECCVGKREKEGGERGRTRISGGFGLIGLRMGKHGQEVHEVEVGGDEMGGIGTSHALVSNWRCTLQ